MTSSTIQNTSSHNSFISVFEVIYSFMFLVSLLTIYEGYIEVFVLMKKHPNQDFSKYLVFIILGLVTIIQYSKIYFNVHRLEIDPRSDTDHFLHAYSKISAPVEKILRLLLAALVLFATKYLVSDPMVLERSFFTHFRSANLGNDIYADVIHRGESYFVPLILAFVFLIIWDCLALKVLKNITLSSTQINYKSGRDFFCLNGDTGFANYKYFGSRKMLERTFGLFLFISAIIYVEMDFNHFVAMIGGILLALYFQNLWLNENWRMVTYFKDPFDQVKHLFSENSTEKVGNFAKGVTVFFFCFALLIKSLGLVAAPSPAKIETIGTVKRDSTEVKNKPIPKVTLATSKNLWCALPLIALHNGYYTLHEIDVIPNYQTAGRYNMDALISNSADFASVVEVNLALLAISVPADVKVLGTVVKSQDFAVIARKSAGIKQISDLKNKRIAFSPGTGGEYFARNFLRVHKIPEKKNTFAKVQPNALQDTLLGRGVDAVATWEPFVSNIKTGLGSDATVFRDKESYTGFMNIAVRQSWAEQHSDLIKPFLLALRDAQSFIKQNPESAKKILAEITTLPLETVNNIWPLFDFSLTFDVEKQINATRTVGELAVATDPAFKKKRVPDYRPYFDAQYFNGLD